ncbi:MAG: hypothetical protein AAFY84_03395 [Pseudomonadota bacterium]
MPFILFLLIAAQDPGLGPDFSARTQSIDPYLNCGCSARAERYDAEFLGTPSDAELRLGPDGLSVLPRQATIFTVSRSDDADIAGTVKVWHVTKPEDCGLTFDYGRQYTVRVKKASDGLETSWCIDPRRKKRTVESTQEGGLSTDEDQTTE